MQEIARQLVHGGLAHITVWMENQPKKAKWIPLETHGDYFIPWNNKQTGETFSRYYHFFTESELVEIIPENCTIINITEEYYNYCLTIRRD